MMFCQAQPGVCHAHCPHHDAVEPALKCDWPGQTGQVLAAPMASHVTLQVLPHDLKV